VKNTIVGLAAAHMITDIYMPVLPAILPLLIADNGYSYLAAGLLVTTYNVTSSCIQPVIGWLSDIKGMTISVSISLFISAIFIALMGIAHDYYLIMVFAILAALGHACFHPTALTIVSRLCSDENRGRITSYFVVGGNIGYAIGPLLTGMLVWWLRLPGILLLIIPAAIMVFVLRRLLPGGITGAREQHARPAVPQEAPQSKRPFAILVIASILRAWAVFAAITFLPTYLMMQGYNLVASSLIVTLMLLAGVAGQVAGGRWPDLRPDREKGVHGLWSYWRNPVLLSLHEQLGHPRGPRTHGLRVLPLVDLCRGDCNIPRAPAAEYRACFGHDARACNRFRGTRHGRQWRDR